MNETAVAPTARPVASLLGLGILAALFFSSTFILNRAMSLGGGHWVWTASLRYGWIVLFLSVGLVATGRGAVLQAVLRNFAAHWWFWLLAGSVGFGIFYTGISFAASYAPSWVVATTWQMTLLASPLVLLAYGRRVPLRGVAFTLLIFAGILLVNLAQAQLTSWQDVVRGGLPVLAAAFAYPAGLQLVWEARRGRRGWIPHITDPVVDHNIGRVLLLTLGSMPVWLLLIVIVQPPPPTLGQWISTAVVAVSSGIIATGIFIAARHRAEDTYQLAAVDATQSSEVIFALAGDVLLLGGALPGPLGWAGIACTVAGLVLYLLAQGRRTA